MSLNGKQPNFLIILTDQERFPPPYETAAIKGFRQEQLTGREAIRQYAVEFTSHYTASTACAPSRTSLFTGHYPSLHGVSQTDGLAKRAYAPDMFWHAPDTVPTLGDYFRAAGYRTFYKGKWHLSAANLPHEPLENESFTWNKDGSQTQRSIDLYVQANPLDGYGFDGWIGPEPHGRSKFNTGINRDPAFAQQTVDLLDQLEQDYKRGQTAPWLVVSSLLNPHDIALFGLLWLRFQYRLVDDSIPDIPPAPTRRESLTTKPGCQQSYVDTYGRMFLPQPTVKVYRRFYYYLQKLVDQHIQKVYERLKRSIFYENTIVVFTSDHGELLGAHGGMHQKWHNAYEESVHVPLLISNPLMFSNPTSIDGLTSHIDLLPTLLGLADIDSAQVRTALSRTHSQAEKLVGRDLSKSVLARLSPDSAPVYFMTDDEISEGRDHHRIRGDFDPIAQPNHVETVITSLPGDDGISHLWKYSRYFDNPQFWTQPNCQDESKHAGIVEIKTAPLPDQFELYNMTLDPLEENNLAHAMDQSGSLLDARKRLEQLLAEQRDQKRLTVDQS